MMETTARAIVPANHQLVPGDRPTCVIELDRAEGKTTAGALWVNKLALMVPGTCIALVNLPGRINPMAEAVVGAAAPDHGAAWWARDRKLTWPGGSEGIVTSELDRLPGRRVRFAWFDDFNDWPEGMKRTFYHEAWAMLGYDHRSFGMPWPRLLITTGLERSTYRTIAESHNTLYLPARTSR